MFFFIFYFLLVLAPMRGGREIQISNLCFMRRDPRPDVLPLRLKSSAKVRELHWVFILKQCIRKILKSQDLGFDWNFGRNN